MCLLCISIPFITASKPMEPTLPPLPTSTCRTRLMQARPPSLILRRRRCWRAIPSSPVAYDPFLHPVAAYQRMQAVLTQMYLQGYITIEQRRAALYEAYQPGFLHYGVIHNNLAPHFVDYTLNELAKALNVKRADLARAGLVVSTTLDLPLQNKVLKIAQKHIAELAKAHRMSDAAEVLIDFHNGAIRVLLGNIDPANPRYGSFDVPTHGYRQPGSSFKPYIYATAFADGMSPGMPVMDAPFTIQLCCGLAPYSPQNYDLRFHGLVSYRYALQNSFNVPGVKVLTHAGVQAANRAQGRSRAE